MKKEVKIAKDTDNNLMLVSGSLENPITKSLSFDTEEETLEKLDEDFCLMCSVSLPGTLTNTAIVYVEQGAPDYNGYNFATRGRWIKLTGYDSSQLPIRENYITKCAWISPTVNTDSLLQDCFKLKKVLPDKMQDTRNWSKTQHMFKHCGSLDMDVSNWKYIASFNSLFYCCGLTSIDLSNAETLADSGLYQTFLGCYNLKYVNLGFKFPSEKYANTFNYAFYKCTELKRIDNLKDIFIFRPASDMINLNYSFCGCEHLTEIDIRNADWTDKEVYMYYFMADSGIRWVWLSPTVNYIDDAFKLDSPVLGLKENGSSNGWFEYFESKVITDVAPKEQYLYIHSNLFDAPFAAPIIARLSLKKWNVCRI